MIELLAVVCGRHRHNTITTWLRNTREHCQICTCSPGVAMTIKNIAVVDLADQDFEHLILHMNVDTEHPQREIHQHATAELDDFTLSIDLVLRTEQTFHRPDLLLTAGEQQRGEPPEQWETLTHDDATSSTRIWAVVGAWVTVGLIAIVVIGLRSQPANHMPPKARPALPTLSSSPGSGDPTRGVVARPMGPSSGDARRGISADADTLRSNITLSLPSTLPNSHVHA